MLDKKKANALAIEKEQPQKAELPARRKAFGAVIDPSPLITLDGELAVAEAALSASKAESERTQALMATNDTSKKSAEASKAQFLADKIKVEGLIRGAQMQWGSLFENDSNKRRAFIDQLVSGGAALIRVDVMPGDALADLPKGARIMVMGREDQPFDATELMPAMSADPKTQAQGFILRVDHPPFRLRPGMALSAWMELSGNPRPGFSLPRSAVLRHDGRTWVYAQEEEEKYVRKPVKLDAPLDGDQGWFVTEDGGLTSDDVIVVVGASSMLSEDLKAQGGGAPD
jgi:multidrug efflux pump subunit AcrA (membrane-fusion protein)